MSFRSRFVWRMLPFMVGALLIYSIFMQEHFAVTHNIVHQEAVDKLSALEKLQAGIDFAEARKPESVDSALANDLAKQALAEKKAQKNKNTSATVSDKTRTWFRRPNPPPSKRSYSEHPLLQDFIIENPDICGTEPVDLLIYVHSAAEHFERRTAIRETWGSVKLFHDITIKTIFILGLPATDAEQMDVLTENAANGDIVQGDFQDTFRNLTMKAITMLTWVNWHCPQVKFLMKSDDDYFVDTFIVVEELVSSLATATKTFMCRDAKNYTLFRNPNNKWHIEKHILPERKVWPEFCSGFFVLFTGDVISELYDKSFEIEDLIAVDDAYLFGLLTEKMHNITFKSVRDRLSVLTRPKPEEEIQNSDRFEFHVFEIESPGKVPSLWELRLRRLTEWGNAHSLYIKIFASPERKRTVVIS